MPPKKRAVDSDVEAKQKRRKKKEKSADASYGEEEVHEKIVRLDTN